MTEASSMPAGWYHAQGDPVGTHRYWDGLQWIGEPQAVATEQTSPGQPPMSVDTTPVTGFAPSTQAADLGPRIIAYIIDSLIMLAVAVVVGILIAVASAISETLGGLVALVGVLAFLGFGIWNFIIKQGNTGQTIGKQFQGIKLVDMAGGQPVGVGKAVIRAFLPPIISTLTFGVFGLLDLVWALFDQQRQRLIDKIISATVAA